MADSRTPIVLRGSVPSLLRLAQVLGLTASAYLCGQTASASYLCCTSFLQAPAPLLAKQWRSMYQQDLAVGSSIIIPSGLLLSYLAERAPMSSVTTKLYLASSLALLACIPYTIFAVKPLNDKLLARASSLEYRSLTDDTVEANVAKDETVHVLVDKWATLNIGRAVLSGLAALLGTYAAVSEGLPVAVL